LSTTKWWLAERFSADDPILRVVKVFADPARLFIVQAPAQRELCGCDLGWICGQSDKVISHHLGRLRRDGLVASRRDGKVVFASLTERGRSLLTIIERVAV
jgi:DNA-binding transcriptional ArsR family regulator